MSNCVDGKAASVGRVHRLLIGMALAVPLVGTFSPMASAEVSSSTDTSVKSKFIEECSDQVGFLPEVDDNEKEDVMLTGLAIGAGIIIGNTGLALILAEWLTP